MNILHKKLTTGKRMLLLFLSVILMLTSTPVYAASSTVTPSKVTVSSVKANTYNKVTVSWKKASNVTSYNVYYKESGATKWTKIANVGKSKTSYAHTSSTKYKLTPGKTYYYTVRGYNSSSKKSGSYNKTGLKVTIPGKPSKVTLNSVTLKSSKKVTISWKKASDATAYRIYYKSSSASGWTRIATVDSSKTSYTHVSSTKYPIFQGTTYSYTVRAYNEKSKTLGSYDKTGKSIFIPKDKTDKPYSIQMPTEVVNNTGYIAKAFDELGFNIIVDNSVLYSGKFDAGDRTITLKYEGDVLQSTMYHELGHFLAFISGKDNSEFEAIYKEEVEKFKNSKELKYIGNYVYSSQNHSEYFAQCYYLYIKENSTMKKILPKTYKAIEAAIKAATPERVAKIKQMFVPFWSD